MATMARCEEQVKELTTLWAAGRRLALPHATIDKGPARTGRGLIEKSG